MQRPATQRPVSGAYSAPCVAQIKYKPEVSKNLAGCQSSSTGMWLQRFNQPCARPLKRTTKGRHLGPIFSHREAESVAALDQAGGWADSA
jgi:hypothetical protein